MPSVPDEYASHLPVLEALSWIIPMRRVLEFGAGIYSTPFFLGLPGCRQLVSVETDSEWRERIKKKYPDPRLRLRTTRPSTLTNFDLVFIDDGDEADQREKTIRWVLGRPHPPVVIHDSEVVRYREAIEELSPDHFTFHTDPRTELVR